MRQGKAEKDVCGKFKATDNNISNTSFIKEVDNREEGRVMIADVCYRWGTRRRKG